MRHELDELLEVYVAVPVLIRGVDEDHDLLLGELVPDVGHEVFELGRLDRPVAVLVEGPEGQADLGKFNYGLT